MCTPFHFYSELALLLQSVGFWPKSNFQCWDKAKLPVVLAYACACFTVHVPSVYGAQQETGSPSSPTVSVFAATEAAKMSPVSQASSKSSTPDLPPEFDFDKPPKTTLPLTDSLALGASVKLEYETQMNFDLDDETDDDVSALEPELNVALSYDPSPRFRAFLDTEFSHTFVDDQKGEKQDSTDLELERAYLLARDVLEGLSLQFGRQRFKDDREWYYDAKLDAIRLFYRRSRFAIEMSASRKNLADGDLLNKEREEPVNNYFLVGRYAFNATELSAYALQRYGMTSDRERPVFLGLRSLGEFTRGLYFWLDLGHVRGTDGNDKIRSYGFDLGSTYELGLRFKPSFTIAYAFGSGDSDPDDNIDKNFRQTGLEDNEARFAGLQKFKYYGSVVDPELSNLSILTAGIGIHPLRRTSLDLVYHRYRRVEAASPLNIGVDQNPQRGNDIGQGLDLILGAKLNKHIRLGFEGGVFMPGDALTRRDNVFFAELKLKYVF